MIVRRRGAQGTPGVYLPVDRNDYYGRFLNIPGVSPPASGRVRSRGLSAVVTPAVPAVPGVSRAVPAVVAGPAGGVFARGADGGMYFRTPSGAHIVRRPDGAYAVRGPAGGILARGPGGNFFMRRPAAGMSAVPAVAVGPFGGVYARGPQGGSYYRTPAGDQVFRRADGSYILIRANGAVFGRGPAGNYFSAPPGFAQAYQRNNAGLSGLGACPDFAPYDTPAGCSNIPPGVDAHEFYTGGGESSETGVVAAPAPAGGFVQTPYTGADVPPGYFVNTMTGQVERLSAAQISSMASGSGAAEASRAAAESEGLEAERIGASRGLSVDCEVRSNCGPVANPDGTVRPGDASCLYFSECNVNGTTGHDAGLLIRPGGFESAVVEAARVSGSPMSSVPIFQNPQAVPFVGSGGGSAAPVSAPALPAGAPPIPAELQPRASSAGSRAPAPAPAPPGGPLAPGQYSYMVGAGEGGPGVLSSLVSGSLSLFGFDIPYWVLAAGGAAFLLRGRR